MEQWLFNVIVSSYLLLMGICLACMFDTRKITWLLFGIGSRFVDGFFSGIGMTVLGTDLEANWLAAEKFIKGTYWLDMVLPTIIMGATIGLILSILDYKAATTLTSAKEIIYSIAAYLIAVYFMIGYMMGFTWLMTIFIGYDLAILVALPFLLCICLLYFSLWRASRFGNNWIVRVRGGKFSNKEWLVERKKRKEANKKLVSEPVQKEITIDDLPSCPDWEKVNWNKIDAEVETGD